MIGQDHWKMTQHSLDIKAKLGITNFISFGINLTVSDI